ncbi:ubiquilin [Nematocida ausubeli]|nr:ubiquilin [Nematocida ausubeli]
MKINVKTSKGEVYSVEVEGPESTVLALKEKISEQAQAPVSKIRLIHVGKLLKDQEPLKTYKLEDDSMVHLVVPSSEKKASPTPSPAQADAQAGEEAHASEVPRSRVSSSAPNMTMPNGWPGQMDPQILNSMPNMDGNSSEMQAMMQTKMKELMKNPEQMKVLMEASLSMQNIPEATKKTMMDSINKFADLAKSNPEQFESFMNHMMDNPNLSNMYMNPGMGGMPGFGQGMPQQPQAQGAQQVQIPAGMMPSFNREEAMKKYQSELLELEQIGYSNVELNLVALVCTEGDLTKAVNLIMDWTSEDNH